MADVFRPWGQLHWLMDKLPGGGWSFLGTLGTEDRCSIAFTEAQPHLGSELIKRLVVDHFH